MNYSNPQQQAIYSSAVSPVHYGSPNHGKFLMMAHIECLSLRNFINSTTTTTSVFRMCIKEL
jgi:hypothetical protein